jgi:hypothetical protein
MPIVAEQYTFVIGVDIHAAARAINALMALLRTINLGVDTRKALSESDQGDCRLA